MQSLFFHLRTQSEELKLLRRQQEASQAKQRQQQSQPSQAGQPGQLGVQQPAAGQGTQTGGQNGDSNGGQGNGQSANKQPWESVDEVFSTLKTRFPLLALTLESMCDQFAIRFKPTADEDVFRLVNALLNDGLQQFINRAPNPEDDGKLPQLTVSNVTRFAENLHKGELKVRI